MKDKLRRFIIIITGIYLVTIPITLFAFQGVGETNFDTILSYFAFLFFHPISLLLILVSSLNKISAKKSFYVFVFNIINILFFVSLSIAMLASLLKGDFILPLFFIIPSIVFTAYYYKYHLRKTNI